MDTPKRTVAKTLSWRIFATLITAGITWLLTRQLQFALTVGLLDTFVKLGSYYVHERAWNRTEFGRDTTTDFEI